MMLKLAFASTIRNYVTFSHLKISPAALWHAKVLGFDLNLKEIVGSGPKGHILKSDILSFKPKLSNTIENDVFSLMLEVPPTNDAILQKCINRITNNRVKAVEYKFIPEVGFLQVQMKGIDTVDGEKIKNLLKMYLNDTRHLLL